MRTPDTDETPQAEPDLAEVVLAARNVSKSFDAVHALKGVNFDVHRGQVTTLFGENGAGKSTLVKILSGVHAPSSGELILDGKAVEIASTVAARDLGITIIHQELSLAPNMTVRDNIFLGREIRGATGVNYAEEERQTRELMRELEEEIDPLTLVEDLRLGQQQIVEIARALSVNSRILIMDEPTSALSASEVEILFKVIGDLKARGVSIVYISHHLEEALEITDHAVVLRDGNMTAFAPRSEIDLEWIVRNMVGENFDLGSPPEGYAFGETALSIDNLIVPIAGGAQDDVDDRVSLDIRAGEIVCIYGLMGAGRTELLECVAGRLPTPGGRVLLKGEDVTGLRIAERISRGLVLTPEDRQRDGLVQTMSVGQNLSLASIGEFVRRLLVSRQAERQIVDRAIQSVTIKTDSGDAPIGSLSGGNQQKVVIGKMLATRPDVVMLDEPSRGIDVGAKAEIFGLLAQGARNGLAVLYTTSEVGECLSIAHRIVVMHKGKISAIFGPDATKEQIMAASGEVNLGQKLKTGYGLGYCHIVEDAHHDDPPSGPLGAAGGAFLSHEIAANPGQVIGAGQGSTLAAAIQYAKTDRAEGVTMVSVMGGPTPDERAHNADLIVAEIGAVGATAELVAVGLMTQGEMDEVRQAGAKGEILGHFFDAEGFPIETDATRRIAKPPLDDLRSRRIVAVAGAAAGAIAVGAVLESRLLNGLIIDEATALEIVETQESKTPRQEH